MAERRRVQLLPASSSSGGGSSGPFAMPQQPVMPVVPVNVLQPSATGQPIRYAHNNDTVAEMIETVQQSLLDGTELESLFASSEANWESIMAVRSQLVQMHVKKSSHEHKKKLAIYVERYRRGESVVDIAKSEGFPPYLLIKFMVVILLPRVAKAKKPLADALLYGDDRLRQEILRCEAEDTDYAPFADRIRQMAGLEFEYKLQRELRGLGILFQHEVDLRVSGFHKTPDVLLPLPLGLATWKLQHSVSVNNNEEQEQSAGKHDQSSRAHIIRWIDSKAMFGDFHTHTIGNKEQLQGYVNRFGPGMVIYWFGFDPKIAQAYPDVVVVDRFPAEAIISL